MFCTILRHLASSETFLHNPTPYGIIQHISALSRTILPSWHYPAPPRTILRHLKLSCTIVHHMTAFCTMQHHLAPIYTISPRPNSSGTIMYRSSPSVIYLTIYRHLATSYTILYHTVLPRASMYHLSSFNNILHLLHHLSSYCTIWHIRERGMLYWKLMYHPAPSGTIL